MLALWWLFENSESDGMGIHRNAVTLHCAVPGRREGANVPAACLRFRLVRPLRRGAAALQPDIPGRTACERWTRSNAFGGAPGWECGGLCDVLGGKCAALPSRLPIRTVPIGRCIINSARGRRTPKQNDGERGRDGREAEPIPNPPPARRKDAAMTDGLVGVAWMRFPGLLFVDAFSGPGKGVARDLGRRMDRGARMALKCARPGKERWDSPLSINLSQYFFIDRRLPSTPNLPLTAHLLACTHPLIISPGQLQSRHFHHWHHWHRWHRWQPPPAPARHTPTPDRGRAVQPPSLSLSLSLPLSISPTATPASDRPTAVLSLHGRVHSTRLMRRGRDALCFVLNTASSYPSRCPEIPG